jgi:phosphoglycerate kinase
MGREVLFAEDTIGPHAKAKAAAPHERPGAAAGKHPLDPREEKNTRVHQRAASLAQVNVSDASRGAPRPRLSPVWPPFCRLMRLLVEKELSALGGAIEDPQRPLVAVLGAPRWPTSWP